MPRSIALFRNSHGSLKWTDPIYPVSFVPKYALLWVLFYPFLLFGVLNQGFYIMVALAT